MLPVHTILIHIQMTQYQKKMMIIMEPDVLVKLLQEKMIIVE